MSTIISLTFFLTSLRYLDAKFHHPSLGASPPNRGKTVFACVQYSRKTENRNFVNNSGIGILCSKNSNGRLAFPSSSWASCFLWNQLACGRRGTTFARASNDTAASKNGENRYISKRYKRGIQLQWQWPIGNGIRAFEWYQFRWPSITMSDYIAHHMCYS